MSRPSIHDELKRRLMEHLAIAETYPPEERPLDVRSVAAVLRISPTTLYKYGLNRQVNAAEQRQRENAFTAGAAIEQDYFKGEIRKLTEEIEKDWVRSRGDAPADFEAGSDYVSRWPRRRWRFSQAFAYNRAAVTKKPYTAKQGQYLAFIFYYTKIHRVAPAEADMENYFKVSPPSVHQMVLTLEANGFIARIPGQGRSIRLLIAREELPDLE
jgi:repressor LexA